MRYAELSMLCIANCAYMYFTLRSNFLAKLFAKYFEEIVMYIFYKENRFNFLEKKCIIN